MKSFENLTAQQKQALLKMPAYITLLAASNSRLDEPERMEAIKLSHILSFSCEPILAEFYKEADKEFEFNIVQLDEDLPKGKETREVAIEGELSNLEKIISKLGQKYGAAMHRSLKAFKEHVSKAHHSVIEDFLLPIPIPGLTD